MQLSEKTVFDDDVMTTFKNDVVMPKTAYLCNVINLW